MNPYLFISFRQKLGWFLGWRSACYVSVKAIPAPPHHPWAGPACVRIPSLPGTDSSLTTLARVWFCFCSGLCFFQLKVRPHWRNEPKECQDRLVVSMQSSRVLPAVPALEAPQAESVWWPPVCKEGAPFNHRRMAANQVLWHRKKSIRLAHSIVKNLCLKLLTFSDYSRSASN